MSKGNILDHRGQKLVMVGDEIKVGDYFEVNETSDSVGTVIDLVTHSMLEKEHHEGGFKASLEAGTVLMVIEIESALCTMIVRSRGAITPTQAPVGSCCSYVYKGEKRHDIKAFKFLPYLTELNKENVKGIVDFSYKSLHDSSKKAIEVGVPSFGSRVEEGGDREHVEGSEVLFIAVITDR